MRLGQDGYVVPELINTKAQPVWFAADRTGCGYYRAVLPARAVHGDVQYRLAVIQDFVNDVPVAYEETGTVNIFQRPSDNKMVRAVADIRAAGVQTWVELDDDIWSLNYQNPAVKHWPKERCQTVAATIKNAAGVIVSTKTLGSVVSRFNRNVAVIPNAIDLDDFAIREKVPGDIIRIGWAGSYTHAEDLKVVLPVLAELAHLPNVRLHVFGFDPFGIETPHIAHGWSMDLLNHLKVIGLLDIAVAPLLDNAFNRSKSAIKWMEHAAHGTPMVLSAVGPYKEVVRHGETGFLAKSQSDFKKYLRILIDDQRTRLAMGEAARREVYGHHTITQRARLWKEVAC